MTRVKLDLESFGLLSAVERMISTPVKDCFQNKDIFYVIVGPGKAGKAIGRGAVNIKKVQQRFGKRVKVVEYSSDVTQFVRNIIAPLHAEEVVDEEKTIVIKDPDRRLKGQIIGHAGSNLQLVNRAVQRFFSKEVRVE